MIFAKPLDDPTVRAAPVLAASEQPTVPHHSHLQVQCPGAYRALDQRQMTRDRRRRGIKAPVRLM